MAFTWTGDPSASVVESIRWEIGDTDEDSPKFQDAEIEYAYNLEGSILGAAARCFEQLAARYADEVDKALGPLRINLSDKARAYSAKARALRAAVAAGEIFSGSLKKDTKGDDRADRDLVQPIFKKEMMKNV